MDSAVQGYVDVPMQEIIPPQQDPQIGHSARENTRLVSLRQALFYID